MYVHILRSISTLRSPTSVQEREMKYIELVTQKSSSSRPISAGSSRIHRTKCVPVTVFAMRNVKKPTMNDPAPKWKHSRVKDWEL